MTSLIDALALAHANGKISTALGQEVQRELARLTDAAGPTYRVSDGHSLAETGTLWLLLELLLTQTEMTLDHLRTIAALGVGGVVDVPAGDAWVRVERME